MASFFADLWSSIFTPGPTPTLLLATNATFAALQIVLFALLFATYSFHFVILSVLCGALWWLINWFVTELKDTQATEKNEKESKLHKQRDPRSRTPGAIDSTESETETEHGGEPPGGEVKLTTPTASVPAAAGLSTTKPPPSTKGAGPAGSDAMRKRRSAVESSGYISTDSEWEKVDEKER
jgi:anaphase-promoting complex subunit 2